ncbi:MAG: tRNA (adenosine(37)-N6)-threonylcarbamoyltransferase complex transferase subunit TsaD, partial [Opitutus sp.]
AVVDALVRKTQAALRQGEGRFRSMGLSGGVAKNLILRATMAALARRERVAFVAARPEHTGDNAAMIAFAAWADRAAAGAGAGMALRIEPGAAL